MRVKSHIRSAKATQLICVGRNLLQISFESALEEEQELAAYMKARSNPSRNPNDPVPTPNWTANMITLTLALLLIGRHT
jgi:hypothetical protein